MRGQAVHALHDRTLQAGLLAAQAGAHTHQQLAGRGGECLQEAKHRSQTCGCTCVPCTTLIYDGMKEQKVFTHGKYWALASWYHTKGLFDVRNWRILDASRCVTRTQAPLEYTPTTDLTPT